MSYAAQDAAIKAADAKIAAEKANLEKVANLEKTSKSHSGILLDHSKKISALELGQLNDGCSNLAIMGGSIGKVAAKSMVKSEVWDECTELCTQISGLDYCDFFLIP